MALSVSSGILSASASRTVGDILPLHCCCAVRHCRVYTSLKLAKNAGSHTGLSNHITRCNARPENKTDGMIQGRLFEKKPIVNSEPLLAETRHAIIVWMAQNGHPFTVVDQPGVSLSSRHCLNKRELMGYRSCSVQRDVHPLVSSNGCRPSFP
jgi:hypothetical protein